MEDRYAAGGEVAGNVSVWGGGGGGGRRGEGGGGREEGGGKEESGLLRNTHSHPCDGVTDEDSVG